MTYRMFSLYAAMNWERIATIWKIHVIWWRKRHLSNQEIIRVMRRWVRRDLFKIDKISLQKTGWNV